MKLRRRILAFAGVAGIALVFPIAAQARTKTVDIGLPHSAQSTFQKNGADVNDFFPHGVTIHAGDKVKFRPTGAFHTVDIPPKGGSALPLIVPTGQKVSGVNDFAGNPFWFNGQDQVSFNPALAKGVFGKHLTYKGKRIDSGLPLGPARPFTVKFKKTGTYTYFCDIHPGMKGKIRVLRRSRRIPSARADRKTVKRELKRDLNIAKGLVKTTTPSNTVDIGVHGAHGVELYAMLPGNLNVHTGATVTFRMSSRSTEDHTATFGDNPETPGTYLNTLAQTFQGAGPFDPRAVYPSDPPTSIATLTPASHGNGFWNSGVLDTTNATPLPPSGKVTFGAPGTYNYYCLIHPFMHGTITVQ